MSEGKQSTQDVINLLDLEQLRALSINLGEYRSMQMHIDYYIDCINSLEKDIKKVSSLMYDNKDLPEQTLQLINKQIEEYNANKQKLIDDNKRNEAAMNIIRHNWGNINLDEVGLCKIIRARIKHLEMEYHREMEHSGKNLLDRKRRLELDEENKQKQIYEEQLELYNKKIKYILYECIPYCHEHKNVLKGILKITDIQIELLIDKPKNLDEINEFSEQLNDYIKQTHLIHYKRICEHDLNEIFYNHFVDKSTVCFRGIYCQALGVSTAYLQSNEFNLRTKKCSCCITDIK